MAKLTFPAELENLPSMIKFISDAAVGLGFERKTMSQIQIASEEALVNIISYAYPDGRGNIEITHNIEKDRGLVIQIVDRGVAFDPLALPDPDTEASIEEREIGGLGVFMMRNIMDEVSYRREGDCNILTLAKC